MPATVEQEPESYSPDNPFAPKDPKGPQPKGYSPDNPFAPKPYSSDNPFAVKAAAPQLPRSELLAGLHNVGLTTEEPTVAPLDESRIGAPPPNPHAQQLTGKQKFASDVFAAAATPFEHPAETAIGTATAPVKAAALLARAGGELERGEPVSTKPKDLAIAAVQVGSLAVAGPAEGALGEMIAPYVGSRAAGLLARTAVGAGIGAAYNPEHPGVGAVVGGAAGAIVNEAAPMRPTVRRLVTDNPARMLPDETTPRVPTATARMLERPALPEEPDFTVEQNAPPAYSPDNPFAPGTEKPSQIPTESETPHEPVGKSAEKSEPSAPTAAPNLAPEKTDLFGNPVAPTVEQTSLLGAGAGTAQSRIDQQQLARKDEAISPEEMAQRRDELGAPKPADEQPKKAVRRKPVEGAVNPKYKLEDNEWLLDRAAELESRLEEYSSGEHGAPEMVNALDRNEVYDPTAMPGHEHPHTKGTGVFHRLRQDSELYHGVIDELKARGVDEDAIEEGMAKRGRTPLAGSAAESFPATAAVNAKAKAAPQTPNAAAPAAPAAPIAPPPAAAAPQVAQASNGVVAAGQSIARMFNLPGASPEAGVTSRTVRAARGARDLANERAATALNDFRSALRKLPAHTGKTPDFQGPRWQWAFQMEKGAPQSTPELTKAAGVVRKLLDDTRNQVISLGTGKLQHWIQDYFPHIWADPKQAQQVLSRMAGARRPIQGSKSFLKHRSIDSLEQGIKAGLIPASEHPLDLVLAKIREMNQYLMAQRIIAELKAGPLHFVSAFDHLPDGHDFINDSAFTVHGPPHVAFKEAYDVLVRQQLDDVINGLGGLTHERKSSVGRAPSGTALGVASSSGDYMATKFATPEGVIMHELGHILDFRYGLYQKLAAGQGSQELSELAKLRHEGQQPDKRFEKYVQGKEEQTANAVHALIYAPEKMAKVAPTVKERLTTFLKADPKLAPLLGIKPSLVLGTSEATAPVGGMVVRGKYSAPKDVADVLNTFLSPGWRGNPVYDLYMQAGNSLNQAQLSFSAFHLATTAINAWVSDLALGIQQLAGGKPLRGLKTVGKALPVVTSPWSNAVLGSKMLREYMRPGSQGAQFAKLVDMVTAAGGRARMDSYYKNGAIAKFMNALDAKNAVGVVGHLFGAAAELSAWPIMQYAVPLMKLGAFGKLGPFMDSRLPKGATQDEHRAALAKAWDAIDNRFGQLVYDNLFWNRVLKDSLMGSTRALGWNLGTIRELGGGARDTAKLLGNASRGTPGEVTPAAAYLWGLVFGIAVLGAVIQKLLTGKDPEGLKDLYYPQTGGNDPDGNPNRMQLPSYMRDVSGYANHPGSTLIHKTHPLIVSAVEMFQNKDFYGDQLRNPDDPLVRQAAQLGRYMLNNYVPIAARGAMEGAKRNETTAQKAASFVGVTPAPREMVRTPAQNKMQEYLVQRGHTSLTPEQKDQGQERRAKRAELLTLPRSEQRTEVREMVKSKDLTPRQGTSLLTRANESPLVSRFKQLTADEALKVWALADAREKGLWAPVLRTKLIGAGRRTEIPPDARKAQ